MKKNPGMVFPARGKLSKILFVVRLKFFLILFSCFQLNAAVHSQNNVRISLDLENVSLEQVIWEIQKKTDFVFMYGTRDIEGVKQLTVQETDKEVNEILKTCLKNTGLWFEISGNAVVIKKEVTATEGRKITGKVVDEKGNPLPGVTVIIKGTSLGTVTSVEGEFTITLPVADGQALLFSFVGMETMEVKITDKNDYKIVLKEDVKALDDVVVTGYFNKNKDSFTGAQVTVKGDELRKVTTGNVLQALSVFDPSIRFEDNIDIGSNPNRIADFTIRGNSGIGLTEFEKEAVSRDNLKNNPNLPTFIMDGFEVDAEKIFDLDIERIESLTILKDASATAIYGSRGANGVVLVTTKKGVEGKVQIYADVAIGVSNILKKYDLLNAYEYATALKEYNGISFADDEMEAYKNGSKGIDWQNLMLQTGISQDYKLGISGGTAKNKYLISANVLNMTAMTITTKYQRAQLRINLDNELTKWLTLSTKINASRTHSHNGGIDIMNFLNYSPTMEMKDPVTGVYNMDPYNSVNGNPYGARVANYGDSYVYALNTNMDLTFKIMKGLTLSVQGAANYSHVPSYSFTSSLAKPGQISGMENASRMNLFWQNTNNVTYNTSFGDHHLTATAVFEASGAEGRNLKLTGSDLANEFVGYWNAKNAKTRDGENGYSAEAIVSGLGRIMYNYKGKYMLTGTFRADGSSKFQKKNKWGYFPSAAVAWDVAKENFMSKQNIVQQLKLRASFGVVGNQSIGAYTTLGMLAPTNYDGYGSDAIHTGYWTGNLATPDVTWESTYQYNIGLDASVLDGRLSFTAEWFRKDTKDLLLRKPAPQYNGGGSFWVNQGEVRNSGVEFTITATPLTDKDIFGWETSLNASYLKNKIIDLAGSDFIVGENYTSIGGGPIQIKKVGYPIGSFYLYEWANFNDQGANLYKHQSNGSLTTNPGADDLVTKGQAEPNWTFGWNNTFTWKNWTLNLFINAALGQDRLNVSRYAMGSMTGVYRFISLSDAYYKSWDKVANKADAVYASHKNSDNRNYPDSDFWLEDASFVKLKNISLTYNIPKKITKVADIQLSVSAQNLFTLTKYTGMDPEVYSESDYGFNGVDMGSYPVPRTFTFGMKLNF